MPKLVVKGNRGNKTEIPTYLCLVQQIGVFVIDILKMNDKEMFISVFGFFIICSDGIKNIIANLGTDKFQRIKIGVGEKPKEWDLADYVLSPFSKEERAEVDEAISHAAKALELMLNDETDAAMNEYNRKVER